MTKRFYLLAVLLVFLCGCGLWAKPAVEAVPAGHRALSFSIDGRERSALVYVPSRYDSKKKSALVLMLHGYGGMAANAARETGWSAKAERENFLVVYPNGSRPDAAKPVNFRRNPQSWNDGSGRFPGGGRVVDDVGFIRALLDRLEAEYAIDGRRVFVTGFSNGASMTFLLGAELSERVAAIAPVAGAWWLDVPPLKAPLSLCYITGTADPLNPLEGGVLKIASGRGTGADKPKPPVLASLMKWVRALGLPEESARDEEKAGVRTRRYGPGASGAEVVFITVEGLGHVWAGGENQLPESVVGKPSDKLRATEVIWEFFKKHPRAGD